MPEAATTTPIFGWRLIRKALSALDVWDYFTEYNNSILDIENTVNGLSDQSAGGTKLYNIARSTWEAKRAGVGYFASVADNGSGKIRVTCVGHGLITGDSINIHDSSVAGYNGTGVSVTRVTANTFDITATAYSATATGYWYCAANAYKAANQDGALVPGSVVRSIYAVNMPTANPTPALFACSDLVNAELGSIPNGTLTTTAQDCYNSILHIFARTVADGNVKFYNTIAAAPAGKLYRIDYVP